MLNKRIIKWSSYRSQDDQLPPEQMVSIPKSTKPSRAAIILGVVLGAIIGTIYQIIR